jgi:hypothetical protein
MATARQVMRTMTMAMVQRDADIEDGSKGATGKDANNDGDSVTG